MHKESAADRLLALCQRAAKGGPDPYAAMLRAEFRIVDECQTALGRERNALLNNNDVPELSRSYQERWGHLLGAIDVYDVAARRVLPTRPSEWDGAAVYRTLFEQARVARLLHQEWVLFRDNGDRNPSPFARDNSASRCFLAGVHAAVDLGRDAATRLGLALIEG